MGATPVFKVEKTEEEAFPVLPENWPAVNLYIRLQNQWHKTVVSTMAGATLIYEGFRYESLKLLIDIYYPTEDIQILFDKLQTLEHYARTIKNELINGHEH